MSDTKIKRSEGVLENDFEFHAVQGNTPKINRSQT